MRLQIMSQLFRNTTVSLRLRPRYGPRAQDRRRRRSELPMRMLKARVKPIATGAKWAGRPATAVLAYLACMGAGLGL
jgi:hypothetical protein